MEQENLLTESSVKKRVYGCLFPPFESAILRGIVMGGLIGVSMAEVSAYLLLTGSVQRGLLPWFTGDVLIVGLSLFETLMAPFVSWLGYRRRRTMMMCWILVPALLMLLVLALPSENVKSGTELCHSPGNVDVGDSKATFRLVVAVLLGVGCVLAKVGLWSHGVAYMDEHNVGDIGLHIGILVAARVVAMLMMPKVLMGGMPLWAQVLSISLPMAISALQLFRIPQEAPPAVGYVAVSLNNRGLRASLARVLTSTVAISQIVAMALLAAALWGFAWHETDIIKVQYNTVYSNNWMATYSDILRYHVVVFSVIIIASKYATSAISSFNKATAVKTAMIVSMMVFPLFIVMVSVFGCERGDVAGLAPGNYSQPACSQSCGCSSTRIEFEPVCVLDQMTTYLSPCHAGCSITDSFSGIQFVANCSCAPAGGSARAALGACNSAACTIPFELHKLVYAIALVMSVLAFQAQGVAVLRSVDERDRSLAFGVTASFVAFITFVMGHATFFGIRAHTCSWAEGERCLLQNSTFPYAVGGTSGLLALLSALLSLVTWLKIRGQKTQKVDHSGVELDDA